MPTVAELSIDVDADDRATATIERINALVDSLDRGTTTIPVDINDDATTELQYIQDALFDLEREVVEPKVDLDTDTVAGEATEVAATLAAIPDETVTVEVDRDGAARSALRGLVEGFLGLKNAAGDERGVDHLRNLTAAASRASTQVNALAMAVAVLGPALVPIGAVAATGIGALGAGFVAAAGGVGLFGAVAKSNFEEIKNSYKAITTAEKAYAVAVTDKQKEAALGKMKAAMDSLDPSQQAVLRGVLSLRDAWREFAGQFKPEMFQMAGEALSFLSSVIPRLTPMMQGMMTAMHNLQRASIAALNGPFWTQFFTNMSTLAGPMTEMLGRAFGNIITGIAGIINAFAPFSLSVGAGFEAMTAKFSAWGQALGSSPGFQAFINYAKANLPAIMTLLGTVGQAFVALVQAAAPIGTQVVGGLTAVMQWVTALGQTNPNLLTLALRIIGIGIAITNLLGPVLTIVRLFGMLSTVVGIIATPIGLVVVGIAALAAAAVYAYNNFEPFRNAVNTVGQTLANFAKAAVPVVVAGFQQLVAGAQVAWQWLQSTFGPAVAAVVQFVVTEFNKFRDWATQNSGVLIGAFSTIVGAIKAIFGIIIGVVMLVVSMIAGAWGGLVTIIGGIWTAISGVISGALQVIRGIILVFAGLLQGDWSAVWSGLVGIVSGIWTAIWAVIRGGVQVVVGIFEALWGAITGVWQRIYDWLVGGSLVPDLVNAIIALFTTLAGFLTGMWNAVVTVITTVWNAIKTVVTAAVTLVVTLVQAQLTLLSSLWSAAWNAISAVAQAVWTAIRAVVQAGITLVRTVVQAGITFIQTVWTTGWTAVQTLVTTVLTAIRTFISTVFTAIMTFIQTTLNTISTTWTKVWTAIKTFVETIWNAIKTFINTTVEGILQRILLFIADVLKRWDEFWTNVLNAVKTGATNVLNGFKELITNVLNYLGGLVSKFFDAGKALITGIIDGIKSMAQAAVDAVKGVVDKAAALLPGSPAKTGPLSGRGWSMVRGQHLVEDLSGGVESRLGDLAATMRDAAGMMSLDLSPKVSYGALAAPAASGPSVTVAAGAVQVQVTGDADAGAALTSAGDQLARQILDVLRRR